MHAPAHDAAAAEFPVDSGWFTPTPVSIIPVAEIETRFQRWQIDHPGQAALLTGARATLVAQSDTLFATAQRLGVRVIGALIHPGRG